MAKELRQSLEKLRAAADITRALAVQMDELLRLREAVQKAEEATARRRPKQRHREIIISPACRARADAPGIEASEAPPCYRARQSSFPASSRNAHSKKAQGKKSFPWQTVHAIPVAIMKCRASRKDRWAAAL